MLKDFDLDKITEPLLEWYAGHARILPWREEVTPYRVWVSEIMLQQTRVEAVKPYFERFMTALPTIRDLAECEEERLLKLWEGLGYYNRVRNLQTAAQTVMTEYGGELPADYKKLLTLKGIGHYTAGAVASIAYGIPMPAVEWTEERMRHVMCFFPFVGLAQGGVLGLWFYLGLDVFALNPLTAALITAAIPLLVTGGIHMDGFMDTMDAIHSYGEREKKLEILKDPHLGAFAVISLAVYLLLYLGVVNEYVQYLSGCEGDFRFLLYVMPGLVFVMERAFSGLSVVTFPSAKKDGLAAGFARTAQKRTDRIVLAVWLVICLAVAAALGWRAGGLAGAAVLSLGLGLGQLLVFWWYYRMSLKEFGGITGDLAGCFLQVCELAGLAVLAALLKTGILGGHVI